MASQLVSATVNGDSVQFACPTDESLLNVLRDNLGLTGANACRSRIKTSQEVPLGIVGSNENWLHPSSGEMKTARNPTSHRTKKAFLPSRNA